MRVLYISNGFPPHRYAGVERHTAALAREFLRRGADVRVLCAGRWADGPAPYNGSEDSVWNGIQVRRLHFNWQRSPDPFGWLHDNPLAARETGRMLDEVQPDLVHVTSCETLSASTLVAAKARRLPIVLSLMDFWFLCPRINLMHAAERVCDGQTTPAQCIECLACTSNVHRGPSRVIGRRGATALLTTVAPYPRITRHRPFRGVVGDVARRKRRLKEALRLPDTLITASRTVRSLYEAHGVETPIELQPYGHDLSWLSEYTGKPSSTVLRVGFVGQIIPSKGLHVLLDAVGRLDADVRRKLVVTVYGDARAQPGYGRQVEQVAAQLPNVQFKGSFAHEAGASVYGSLDVLVVPSLWADFPLVIHEAFATGTPVVASNLGGMAENVTPEVDGLLFEPGDAEALAGLLTRLVAEPNLLERLTRGIRPVRSILSECDELELVYRRLLDRRVTH